MTANIILASASPRRQQLLRDANISFTVKTIETEENFPDGLSPQEAAIFVAQQKLNAISALIDQQTIIIAADTMVVCEGKIFNKPSNEVEAMSMLAQLSGKAHQVVTGVCLQKGSRLLRFSDTTTVYFNELNASEISYYVYTHKPFDKAGAYAIQEWIGLIGINRIDGDFYNVMGLPVNRVLKALHAIQRDLNS